MSSFRVTGRRAGVGALIGIVVLLALIVTMVCAWISHVVACINNEQWILLIIGIIVFPIGWLHGIGLWLGWFTT